MERPVANVERMRTAIFEAIKMLKRPLRGRDKQRVIAFLRAAVPVAHPRYPDVPKGARPIIYYSYKLDELFDEIPCERRRPCMSRNLCPSCRAAWCSKQIARYLEDH